MGNELEGGRREFRARLADLREAVLEMAELVQNRLDRALSALRGHRESPTLARSVIDSDRAVNDRYLALESECISLLALQQPVAGDLRLVTASFKIITDLERIGDLTTNLAEYALEGDREFPEIDMEEPGSLAGRMVADAIEAYAAGDDEWACREVAALDDDLDARCEHASNVVVRYLLGFELEARDETATIDHLLEDVSLLLYTIRDLERIGDHAVNVAARTLYMVEGDSALV
jgi:phosphate transport system protein